MSSEAHLEGQTKVTLRQTGNDKQKIKRKSKISTTLFSEPGLKAPGTKIRFQTGVKASCVGDVQV